MSKLPPFKQGFLGGLAAMVVAALIFVAGAAAVKGGSDSPVVGEINNQNRVDEANTAQSSTTVESSSAILHVFQTSATFNGAGPAGYGRSAMHEACRLEDPISHFCTIQEIENAWKTGGVDIAATSQSWIDNAVLGTGDSSYNGDATGASDWYGGSAVGDFPYNCNAWTNSANAARGLILNTGAISPATEACDDIHPVACCRFQYGQLIYLPLVIK